MPKLAKSLTVSLAAFYTICSCLTARADDEKSTSASILKQIDASVVWKYDEWRELIFDYLYALKTEGKSAKEQLELLTKICDQGKSSQQFRYGPVYVQHWLIPLSELHVNDLDSMKVLDRALSTFVQATPLEVPRQAAERLWKLGCEVEKVETDTTETKKVKVLTIWHLALLTQKDKVFGRKLGTMALEHMANFVDTPAVERRDAIFRTMYGYSENPRTKYDGDLLYRNVFAIAKILKNSKDLDDIANTGFIYYQLALRCAPKAALVAQKEIADSAKLSKPNETITNSIYLQLAAAYLGDQQISKAEKVLQEIRHPSSLVKLLVADCFCRQRKYLETEKLTKNLELISSTLDVQYPNQIIAAAKAIRAQSYVDQKKYASALPLLVSADQWFSGNAYDNVVIREHPYLEKILPSEANILSNLVLVYDKLGRKQDKRRTAETLSKVQRDNQRKTLLKERDELLTLAARPEKDSERTFDEAKRYIEIVRNLEESAKSRTTQILEYAELLIAYGKENSAELCLNNLMNESLSAENSDPESRLRLAVDRIFIAEAKGDLATADSISKALPESNEKISLDNQLRVSEAKARLSILNGKFEQAELSSRLVESVMEQTSNDAREHSESNRDKYVRQHQLALLDRVQTLNHVHKFKEAAKLSRLLLRTNQWPLDHIGADAAANLAYAYSQDGHLGLAATFRQEAEYKGFGSYYLPPSRYLADAKMRLADLAATKSNPIRAERYRAEAREIRDQTQKQQQSTP